MSARNIQELGEDILKYLWTSHPVLATGMGVHTFDHLYADYSQENREAIVAQKKSFISDLKSFKDEDISLSEAVDRDLMIAFLDTEVYKEEVQNRSCTIPSIYPDEALMGVQQLQINYALPIDQRVVAIMGRLNNMPTLLEQGIENLKSAKGPITTVSISVALDALKNGKQFLEEIVPQFSGTVPMYFKDLLDSNTIALRAMHQFEDFLLKLLPNATSNFACGKAYFEFLLKDQSLMDYSIEEVIEHSESVVNDTLRLLDEVGRELDRDVSWQELVAHHQKTYPDPEGLLHYYKGKAEQIRDFMIQEELFTLPEDETLVIMETPIFQRSLFPFSGYVTPAPFEKGEDTTGYFWVTPVSSSLSEEEREQRLEAHNVYNVTLTNIHHAYPGQHLLFVKGHQHPSAIRKALPDYCLAQGWPFYCEEMLFTEGLFSDLTTRLFQLKDQLWRAYRALIDAKLHLGDMQYDEAVDILVNQVGLDKPSAEAEVKRYCLYPTSGVGYLLGKSEIIKLRQEVSDIEGEDFSLIDFHDNLLSFGMIPLPLLKKHMINLYQEK